MRLSVVIPQHSESEDDIRPLLASLDGQIAVDFADIEVCVVNDHSDALLSPAFLSSFLNIRPRYVVRGENGGPGMARQTGIGSTTGEYIMFCDADDVLHDVLVLDKVMTAMEQQPDIVRGEWLEERSDGTFAQQKYESTWLHGKAFRREFLNKESIAFDPRFRVHEDTYFCGLAWECAATKALISAPLYVWRWNPASITRSCNGAYASQTFGVFLDSALALLREMRRRQCRNTAAKAARLVAYARSSQAAMRLKNNASVSRKIEDIEHF